MQESSVAHSSFISHENFKPNLVPKAFQAMLIGYDSQTKAHRCFDPLRKKIIINRDITFLEDILKDFHDAPHHDIFADLLDSIAALEEESHQLREERLEATIHGDQQCVAPPDMKSNAN